MKMILRSLVGKTSNGEEDDFMSLIILHKSDWNRRQKTLEVWSVSETWVETEPEIDDTIWALILKILLKKKEAEGLTFFYWWNLHS